MLNTWKSTYEAVIKNKGDYVAILKGTQENLVNHIKDYFDSKQIEILKKVVNSCYTRKTA